jgi:hypothetical protein
MYFFINNPDPNPGPESGSKFNAIAGSEFVSESVISAQGGSEYGSGKK